MEFPEKRKYPQSKNWCITFHVASPTDVSELPLQVCPKEFKGIIGQLEQCPDTHRLHWQMFCVFPNRMRLSGVKSAFVRTFGPRANSVHAEPARGSVRQNVSYCSKEESCVSPTYRFCLGCTMPTKSVQELPEFFRRGGRVSDFGKLPEWDPVVVRVSLPRLYDLRRLYNPRRRDPSVPILFEVHYGPPGSGKSRRVFGTVPEAYPKLSGKWWDFYEDEETVILDDFDGCFIQFGDFKRILDRYPVLVEVKGTVVSLLATKFYVTTNVYPSHWWSLGKTGAIGRDAIWRRITCVYDYSSGEPIGYDPIEFRQRNQFLEKLDPKGERTQ